MSNSIDELVLEEVRNQPDSFTIVHGGKVWDKAYILANWDKDDEMWSYLVETLMIEAAHLGAHEHA